MPLFLHVETFLQQHVLVCVSVYVCDSHMLFILVMQLSPLGSNETFFFLTRGSQTGPVPNNTHSHLHNPSVPKGRRGRETEHLRRQEKEKNREGDEKKRMERERKRRKCIEKKMMGEKKG